MKKESKGKNSKKPAKLKTLTEIGLIVILMTLSASVILNWQLSEKFNEYYQKGYRDGRESCKDLYNPNFSTFNFPNFTINQSKKNYNDNNTDI